MTKVEECAAALQAYCRKVNFPYQPTEDQAKDLVRHIVQALLNPTPGMYDKYRCDELWRDLNSEKVFNLWIEALLKEDLDGQAHQG